MQIRVFVCVARTSAHLMYELDSEQSAAACTGHPVRKLLENVGINLEKN